MPAALMVFSQVGGMRRLQDQLGQHEEDAAAVQRREREEVQHAQADGQDADELQREVGGRLGGGGRRNRRRAPRGSGYRG